MSNFSFKLFVFEKCNPKLAGCLKKRDDSSTAGRSRPRPVPKPRSGHRIVCDDGNLYSLGGFNPDNLYMPHDKVWEYSKPLFKELWKYNFATKTWLKLECQGNIPDELASNAVTLSGGTFFIFGGTGVPFGESCSNQLHLYNIRDNTMQLVDVDGKLPNMQYGQAIVRVGSYIYTVGGTTGFDYSADIHRLDFHTKNWEEVYICTGDEEVEPQGRYRHELAFDGTRLFLLGGGTASTVFGFQDLSAFNVDSSRWEKLITRPDTLAEPPGYPQARRCHGCVQMTSNIESETQVFISGGYDGNQVFNDVWRLELSSLQWTYIRQCKMPRPVYFHSTAITPAGRMYSFGGIEKQSDGTEKRTADLHAVWLCVPKLSAMCWEAVIQYSSNLELLSKDKLIQIGVPLKYVELISLA